MNYKLISGSLNDTDRLIETILFNRGIHNPNEYLKLTKRYCANYDDLDNITEAVECFNKHFEQNDNIAILVDCDPDGYTSAAMIYMYIKRQKRDYPVSYIIHNNNKAHGLAKMNDGDFEIPIGTKLLILPDSSSNDRIEMNKIMNKGIDVIVLDHHEIEPSNVVCDAIIVNNQSSPRYTNKAFSGAGIVYEFLKALDEANWTNSADDYLDLVALAQISDIMDLSSFSTRYYVNRGLNRVTNPMLCALIDAQSYSMNDKINPTTIAWFVVPILNAMIRIGSYEERELLFRAFIGDYEEFDYKKRSGEIIKENIYDRAARLCKNAKGRQDKMRNKLYDTLVTEVDLEDKVVIIEVKDADPGIIGLSAMHLADNIKRPVVILRDTENNMLGGSIRNYDHSPIEDLKELLNSTGLFKCQGHSNAAGAEIKKENLQQVKNLLNEQLKDIIYDDIYMCDFLLDAEEVDVKIVTDMDRYDWVWGTGVKEPYVAVTNITVSRNDIQLQGKDLNSIAFVKNNIKYVAFKLDEDNPLLEFMSEWGEPTDTISFDAVVTCGINVYQGIAQCQCIIKDVTIQND